MASPFWARIRRFYLAGILVLAPTALTLWVVWSLFIFFDNILGFQLRARGISVFGLGFVLLNVLLLLLGWLTASFLGRRAFSALGPRDAPGPAHQQDLRDAAADRGAFSRTRPGGVLRPSGDRGIPLSRFLGSGLRDLAQTGRSGSADRPRNLQRLHSERRQPDHGISPSRAGGTRPLPRHDRGAGDEDDRVGRAPSCRPRRAKWRVRSATSDVRGSGSSGSST